MKIKILKSSKRELKIELEGEGHTFCNALQEILIMDKNIEYAGYDLPHPLVGQPIIYVRTKNSEDPKSALVNAAKILSNEMEEFESIFKKRIEEKREANKG